MKKTLLILFLNFLFMQFSFAQNIKGFVKNSKGEALTGALVSIENTYRTTITDSKGYFEFSKLQKG